MGIDKSTREITMKEICRYNYKTDDWSWNCTISEDKRRIGEEENHLSLEIFERELAALSHQSGEAGRNADWQA